MPRAKVASTARSSSSPPAPTIDLTDPDGVTPLLSALLNAHFDTAKYLLEAGANVNKWDFWGRTPLYAAVDFNTLPHGGRPDRPSLDDTTGARR